MNDDRWIWRAGIVVLVLVLAGLLAWLITRWDGVTPLPPTLTPTSHLPLITKTYTPTPTESPTATDTPTPTPSSTSSPTPTSTEPPTVTARPTPTPTKKVDPFQVVTYTPSPTMTGQPGDLPVTGGTNDKEVLLWLIAGLLCLVWGLSLAQILNSERKD